MKHVRLFEDFLFEGGTVPVTKDQEAWPVSRKLFDYIKKVQRQ